MNSEELEQSLRSEFETFMNGIVDKMRDETREFQSKIEAEFDKHKAQLDDAFRTFGERFQSGIDLDEGFRGSVGEHLRLARDEGAKIAATAMEEAEKLDRESQPEPAAPKYDAIRDAVADIAAKDSQSAILKALVQHAEQFAPRGAFFVIKNEHFVGWKVFGEAGEAAEDAIRDIHFPTAGQTVLGDSVARVTTVDGATSEADFAFLAPLEFGKPENAVAVPLVARGRGVAVLYADGGEGGNAFNREALETITRVAGLTVELLAAAGARADDASAEQEAADEISSPPAAETTPEPEYHADAQETSAEPFAEPYSNEADHFETYAEQFQAEPETSTDVHEVSTPTAAFEMPGVENLAPSDYQFQPAAEEYTTEESEPETAPETAAEAPETAPAFEPFAEQDTEVSSPFAAPEAEYDRTTSSGDAGGAMVFDSGGSIEPASQPATSPFEQPVNEYEPAGAIGSYSKAVEPVAESRPVTSMPHSRLSDRNVDLPIDVPEDERRLHNDARRFARLLVSEIKLYNEKKVLEGRQAHDLYDRLREAIDRSREMYDKRVQPPVAAKFDYFHYEMVNSLAEGNAERLGEAYPGATV